MKTTTLSVLAGIAISLFAYIVLVERHQLSDIELEGRGARLIERFSRRRVREITVQRPGHDDVRLVAETREGDDEGDEGVLWTMEEPVEARGESSAVSTLLGALEWAQPRRKIEGVQASELGEYGLTEPAVRVTLAIADETLTLSIGNRDATDVGRYAILDDPSVVYVVGDDVFEAADHDADHFRSRELFPDPLIGMRTLTLQHAGVETRLEQSSEGDDDTWRLTAPVQMLASAQRVRDIKRAVGSLEATRFAPAGAELGTVFLRFESSAKPEENAPMAPVLLLVGEACGEHEGERYARVGEEGALTCVRADDLDPLLRPADDLRELRPITVPDTDVEAIDLVVGRDRLHIEDQRGEWSYTLTRAGAAEVHGEVDPDSFSEWLSAIRAAHTAAAEPADAAELTRRGLDAPRATLTMHGRGSAPDHTLSLGAADMRGVFVRRDDEDVVLVVDAEVESRLQVSVMPFLPRRLLRDRAEGLARVQTTGEHAQTLERDGNGDFAVAAPIVAAADGAAARDLARRLATLEAVRFVAEEPATEHGLGQPRLTARFRFDGPLPEDAADEHAQNHGQDDGHGHGHEPTGPDAPDRDHTLRVGAATEGGAFAQLDERPEVFILPRAVLDALDKPLVSSDLLRTRRTELSAFTLERGGVTLEVTHDGAAFVTRDGTVPDERMEGVLMSLERMRGDRAVYGVAFDPALSLTVNREADAAPPQRYTLRIGPAGATHTPVQRADLEVTFQVPNDQVAPLRDFQP